MKSSQPLNALEMRCDIQDNLIALNLAKNIAPAMEPIICRKLAMQIEVRKLVIKKAHAKIIIKNRVKVMPLKHANCTRRHICQQMIARARKEK
jgi:hypothetical protein